MESESIKAFYKEYADHIVAKRWRSKYPIRAYVHENQYQTILAHVKPGMNVLDAGCGEGILSLMMAEKGANVIGIDLSVPNIEACKARAAESNLSDKVSFQTGDVEDLPFMENYFDLVVSSHVLEHLPDFNKGLSEVMRVTKKRAVVAIPTINNPCSWIQVGKGWYFLKGIRSFLALPFGFLLSILALVLGKDGVNESYGRKDIPHIFRFIHTMKKRISAVGVRLVSYEATSILLPYFSSLLPIVKFLDQYKDKPILRNFGYGTTFTIEKR
jgi:2-polyprenyl-3-methyl-5-hydroxy-6-metoxy-1,4-benzoquinol methylase